MADSFLSRRVLELVPSATLVMSTKAKNLKAAGVNVISLSIGEPDFKTPKHICEAAKKAIDDGMHGYTAVPGTPELRKAMAKALTRDTGVEYKPEQTVASPGGKYSIFLALMALVNPGDEVIIPTPCWVSYPEMVRLVGGVPVTVETREEEAFALRPEALEKAITPKTKLLMLNSPSNPTGQVIPPEVMVEIGRVMEKKGIWCITDEIYNHLVFDGVALKSLVAVSDYCRDHSVVVNGCSKTYAMTGWRMGWIGARKELATAIDDLQGQTCSNICAITQAAAVAAINGPQDCVGEMAAKFDARRKVIVKLLNEIPGVRCSDVKGAFYTFPNISGILGKTLYGVKIDSPTKFCEMAIDKAHVATVAGEPFGSDKHIRVSFTADVNDITEGCRRLKALVEEKL